MTERTAGWLEVAGRAGTLARIAMAGRRVRRENDPARRAAARRALASLLADARGIPMKVGQMLADGSADDPFRALVTGVEPLPLDVIQPALEAALGADVPSVFEAFEAGASAASLGQVHRARLRTGELVAVKVQYPCIAAAVSAELELAGLVPGVGPARRWGFDLDGYRRVLRGDLDRELDYRGEAERQATFAAACQVPGLVVPRVHAALCSRTVLVQSWETGDTLDSARSYPLTARLHVGRILLETLLTSVFATGLVHGDPHPGNYLFRNDGPRPEVVLLDFGCVVDLAPNVRRALLGLLVCTREGDPVDALACFAEMGFDARKLAPIADRLRVLSRELFRPFLSDAAFDVASWGLGPRVEALLGELKWWFRSAGPPELFLLLRAFQGLVSQLVALDVRLPWWPLLRRAVGAAALDEARAAVRALGAAATEDAPASTTLLHVEVHRGAERRVALSFPAREALRLGELVPEDVASRLELAGVRVDQIEARLSREGLAAQTLFEQDDGTQRYRVWLE